MKYTTRGMALSDRLINKSVRVGDCLEWTGSKNKAGYGVIKVDGKPLLVTRAAYADRHGEIPAGLIVRHRCDNPACFKDEHLILGTHKDNSADAISRQRQYSILSEQDVDTIRAYTGKQKDMATRFEVSEATISLIVNNKHWRHML